MHLSNLYPNQVSISEICTQITLIILILYSKHYITTEQQDLKAHIKRYKHGSKILDANHNINEDHVVTFLKDIPDKWYKENDLDKKLFHRNSADYYLFLGALFV